MKKRNLYALVLLLVIFIIDGCNPKTNNQEISVIPKPNKIDIKEGTLKYPKDISIVYQNELLIQDAEYLAEAIKNISGFELKTSNQQITEGPSILLSLNDQIDGDEAYSLKTDPDNIVIEAKTSDGIFYGIQTFLQLFHSKNKSIYLPSVEINDEPRYSWRGMHLDVARHFFPVSFVKKMIDMLAMHKMNTFHWHLTEDQGWRIEIKKYPKLTKIGSKRDKTIIGHTLEYPHKYDNTPHEGYYTQEEIKEVVKYAQSRHITIVPEIEMPGHAQAAVASYPELSCFPDPSIKPWTDWGISQNVYCAGKDETFKFLEDVLSEVIELFPGDYIHIGGDECPKSHWEKCPLCQKRMKKEGLKDEHELQSYFIKRIEKFLSSRGKKLIGWDEILEGGLAEGAAVMSWRGEKGGIEAAAMGHPVVMTPTEWCYFDKFQSTNHNEPLSIGRVATLEKVYSYNPTSDKIPTDNKDLILGTQANVWTEYIASPEKAEYMIFPRLCALSEVCWTEPEQKEYNDFKNRMNIHYGRLANAGINFRLPTPEGATAHQIFDKKSITISLSSEASNSKIYYTTDGTEPTENSIEYKKPVNLDITNDIELKAITSLHNQRSITSTFMLEYLDYEPVVANTNLKKGLNCYMYYGPFKNYDEVGGTIRDSAIIENIRIPENLCDSISGWKITGFIQIEEEGDYTFELSGVYKSALYIADKMLVDNSLAGYWSSETGNISLKKGYYPLTIKYFNGFPRCYVVLRYRGHDFEMKEVPAEILFH